ncbi:MAG: hypothetical protein K0U23_00155, partial [Gammaproteobacteria bacterium]|nr:hypothetical protein [Gammaproteobacteria bacterium]
FFSQRSIGKEIMFFSLMLLSNPEICQAVVVICANMVCHNSFLHGGTNHYEHPMKHCTDLNRTNHWNCRAR